MVRQDPVAQSPVVIFDAEHDRVKPWGGDAFSQKRVPVAETGRTALQMSVERFAPPPSAVSFRHEVDDELDSSRDLLGDRTTLRVARGPWRVRPERWRLS